jgi:hypothetical protein
MKAIIKKYLYIFGYLLEPCIEIWQDFLSFDQIMATENLKQHLILALKIFDRDFWLQIASQKERPHDHLHLWLSFQSSKLHYLQMCK